MDEKLLGVLSHVVSKKTQAAFRGASKDSFTGVLSMLSYSSMYEKMYVKIQTLLINNDHKSHKNVCVTDPIFLSAG